MMRRLLRLPQFIRFCLIGFICYLVDAAIVEILASGGISPVLGRLISIGIALQCGYYLHGIFTFHGHGHSHARAWTRYMASNIFGASLNYLVFFIALHTLPIADPMLLRQISVICGVGIAMWFNFWANRRFVFGHRKVHHDDA